MTEVNIFLDVGGSILNQPSPSSTRTSNCDGVLQVGPQELKITTSFLGGEEGGRDYDQSCTGRECPKELDIEVRSQLDVGLPCWEIQPKMELSLLSWR
jgi:hypothetical protein